MVDTPIPLLERLVDAKVTLLLKDSRQLSGRLIGLDEHLNLVLDDASETTPDVTRRLGRVVLRGSNIVTLHAPDATVPKTH
jgi:small nuclear ribonucleoprotein (snRNP)-like protein